MSNYFSAKISQEYSESVKNLAISSGVEQKNIVFKTAGCPIGTLGVYIKFESSEAAKNFSSKVEESFPCIIEKWWKKSPLLLIAFSSVASLSQESF